jgi:hypothetical protein
MIESMNRVKEIHYRVHKCLQIVLILSQVNSLHLLCNENQLDAVYSFNQTLYVSDIYAVHYQEADCIYTITGAYCIQSIPPDDGLQICPKLVEVDLRNRLRINSVSSWFLLHRCI